MMRDESLEIDQMSQNKKLYFNNRLEKIALLFSLFTIFAVGCYLRWESLEVVRVVDFFIRDVERAFNIIEGSYLPLAGPELNNGGRLPGPAMYILLVLPLLIHPSYEAIFIFNFILNIATIPLLFFFIKNRFGIGFSTLTSVFFALSLHHIEAVIFPMNPSFIFPFSVLYIGALFNFAESRNPKYLLWILLIILLGIQFHFSIASYSLPPILLIILFRKKIPGKTILAGLVIAGICFLPYIIHKNLEYSPKQAGVSIERKVDTSFIGFVKIATVQNTISRLAHSQPFEKGNIQSKTAQNLFRIGFSIAFYSLIFFIANKIKKQGLNSSIKEIAIVSSFYFPALIYEIINPWKLHFWYQNIFILPGVLVFGLFVVFSYEILNGFFQKGFIVCLVILALCLQVRTFNSTKEEIKYLNEQLWIHVNPSGSYKNSKILLSALMEQLELNPREFFERVYLLDFVPSGYRRLKFAYSKKVEPLNKASSQKKKSCYFIMSTKMANRNNITKQSHRKRYNIYELDKNIKIIKDHMISFSDKGFPIAFRVSEYIPKQNQSCYSNSFNQFVTTKSIRNLLIQAKSLSKTFNTQRLFGINSKTISEKETYNSNNELEFFNGEYVIQNGLTQTPFKFKLFIRQLDGVYSLRGEIESYYFFGSPSFNMSSLNIAINTIESIKKIKSINSKAQVINRYGLGHSVNILSKATLATTDFYNIMSNNALWNYNRDWYREINLPKNLKFEKDKFFIDLDWIMVWRDGQFCCYTDLTQRNFLNLKKPKN
jgi:hypothetical protein